MKYIIIIIKIIIVFLTVVTIGSTYYEVGLAERRWLSSLKNEQYGLEKEKGNYTCSDYEREIRSNTYKSIYYTFKEKLQTELQIVFFILILQLLIFFTQKKIKNPDGADMFNGR